MLPPCRIAAGQKVVGSQHAGAHRRVIGDDAGVSDGGQSGGAHDDKTGWRNVIGGIFADCRR